MADLPFQDHLIERLAETVGQAGSVQMVSHMIRAGVKPAAILALLDELVEVSPKVAQAAIRAISDLHQHADLSILVSWLDFGIALAGTSGAIALRYFNESPRILVSIEPHSRQVALQLGLELAEQDANVAWEYLRTSPRILSALTPDLAKPWLEIGLELSGANAVVGLEYIRQIPQLASVLPCDEVRPWLSFGLKLIAPNTQGKTDYLATIEFLRNSPAFLGDIEQIGVRSKVVTLGSLLADQSAESAILWLADSPRLLRTLPSVDWQMKALQYGLLLAERDAETTRAYLSRCPEIIGLIGNAPQAASRFEDWFKAGMEVLAYSPEGARAYFAVESHRALTSVEQALSGVSLRQVARSVKLFVEGLCGTDVSIAALPDSFAAVTPRAMVSGDGRTILLPALLRRYQTAEENQRLYLLMAAHEAGHLEFGTYRLTLQPLADVIEAVRRRYDRIRQPAPDSLASLFRLYPHPQLIEDLWTLLEDARIEWLLQEEYPGLRRDLARMAGETVTPRDPAQELTAKELIVDCLLRLSTGESEASAVPAAVKNEVSTLWRQCQSIFSKAATAEDVVRCVHDLYIRIEDMLAPRAAMIESHSEPEEHEAQATRLRPAGDEYRPVANWLYRGTMNPALIKSSQDQDDERTIHPDNKIGGSGASKEKSERRQDRREGKRESTAQGDAVAAGRSLPSVVEDLLNLEVQQLSPDGLSEGQYTAHYDEWDHTIQDYRLHWCRVTERPAEAGSDEFVSTALTIHRSSIRTLRRFFESLRLPVLRRVSGRKDGEDLDIDALVCRAAELHAGLDGGDRVYIKREKKEREVAAAFLVDVSGSTSRQVESGRRVIDVEKEGLVL
ncbi:MAG TPA: hypothetical protein VIU63_01380, partial [Nitrospira sp.]